jgi:hypothetical protein
MACTINDMSKRDRNRDIIFLILLIAVAAGLPVAMFSYDQQHWPRTDPASSKTFTLTAHSKLGWLPGRVKGYDILTLGDEIKAPQKVVLEVARGDRVVIRLASSDVIHGFTLKDFGIFIEDGVHPGKVVSASFTADKVGTFTFSCNIICGKNHENMQGTLIVKA